MLAHSISAIWSHTIIVVISEKEAIKHLEFDSGIVLPGVLATSLQSTAGEVDNPNWLLNL